LLANAVYRSFDIDSDHYPVIATLKLKLKSTGPHQAAHFIPYMSALSKPAVRKRYAATVSHALSSTSTESHSVDRLWTCYKSTLDTAAWEVLGPRRQAKQPWISQATLSIVEQWRRAVLAGDVEEYKRLAGPRRRALRHDKQQWAEQIALEGEQCLCSGEIKDAFTKFCQLRPRSTVPPTPLKAADGSLLSDRVSVVSRWKKHFCNLLNRPLHDPPDVLVTEAEAAVLNADVDTRPATILETYRAARMIKAGTAPSARGIYLEYIHCGGHTALSALNDLFFQVWEEEAIQGALVMTHAMLRRLTSWRCIIIIIIIPDEWCQGIIIPLYKA